MTVTSTSGAAGDRSAPKTIGILGGMGPRATADLYLAIVALFQQRYGARYDADFPQMLINSIPAPDVVEQFEDEARLVSLLSEGAQTLEQAGADFVAIACNTVHAFHTAIASSVSIPVLDLVAETVAEVHQTGYTTVGLLSTGLTLERGLYRAPCTARGLTLLEPDEPQRQLLTALIMDLLAGRPPETCGDRLMALVEALAARGAEAVILGCTDLTPVIPAAAPPLPLFDTTGVLAQAAVREALRPGL